MYARVSLSTNFPIIYYMVKMPVIVAFGKIISFYFQLYL